VSNFYIKLLVWTVAVGALFAFCWKRGYLAKLASYVAETREELKKCSWPTREELWQSTVLIGIVIASLGLFTIGVDFIILKVVRAVM
jgi:preprotein translocase subunit SecE